MSSCFRRNMVAFLIVGFALSAQAGPAMFSASFIIEATGNDVTTGTAYPYSSAVLTRALPLGYACQSASPSTPNGIPNPLYCSPSVLRNGQPATGSGTLITGTAMGLPASIVMAQSAVYGQASGSLPTYYPYLQSFTYATIYNAAGTFFAGGGPAAGLGQVIKTGMGQSAGTFVINEGKSGFGGAMGLLGKMSYKYRFVIPGKVGTYVGTDVGGTPHVIGRTRYATVIGTNMGNPTAWENPYTVTGMQTNNVNGNQTSYLARHIGSAWTTGAVTVYALGGAFQTILRRSGYDTPTAGGARNIQLVTPWLTHWISPGFVGHTAGIGIFRMQVAPEPGAALLLAAGGGVLALLYRRTRGRRI